MSAISFAENRVRSLRILVAAEYTTTDEQHIRHCFGVMFSFLPRDALVLRSHVVSLSVLSHTGWAKLSDTTLHFCL